MLAAAVVLGIAGRKWYSADGTLATTVPAPRDAYWLGQHEQINARARQGNVDLIFIGDSITQGWHENGQQIWDEFYGQRKAMAAGIGGDRTQHVLWRLDHGNVDGIQPKVAVLMIGTNNSHDNTSEEIALGVQAIVARLRVKLPTTKILVLGIFPRGPDAWEPNRLVNIAANERINRLADDKQVFYLDIGEKFLKPDGSIDPKIMPDYLHLTPQGYRIWAETIDPQLATLLGETK